MNTVIHLKEWDIIVLPEEGKVLGRPQKDGTRKEIYKGQQRGYHRLAKRDKRYPELRRSRLIWFAVYGTIPKGMQINHKNHNTADDRIDNLELVTASQNTQYRRKPRNNTSGYKGVYYQADRNKYRAGIRVNYKRKSLGYYTCPIEAARAYDKAALELFGNFAILNFPSETLS